MRHTSALLLCFVIVTSSAHAQDSDIPGFLRHPGKDFVFQFAGRSPFRVTTPVDDDSDNKSRSGRRAVRTHTVKVFTVVSLAGDSWILVEHPKNIEDADAWNAKRVALASLTPQAVAALESTGAGKKKLKQLRQQSAVEIETARTWVNIDHIATIRKASIEPSEFQSADAEEQ